MWPKEVNGKSNFLVLLTEHIAEYFCEFGKKKYLF